jgi:CelD/BcsL family acetyltransferase involved in cellulose biosynthesis
MDSASATGDAVHKIANLTLLEAIEDEWKALQSRASYYSQCQTYEYCELVAKLALDRGRSVYLVTARDSGLLVGVWMLTLQREGWLRILRPASCGTNEEYSWPLLSADTDELAQRIFHLAATISADRLMIYNVPKDSAFDRAVAASAVPKTCGPIEGTAIKASEFSDWKQLETRLSKKFRAQLRTDVEQLNKECNGQLKIGWCHIEEEAERAQEFYFRNKREWLIRTGRHSPWLSNDCVADFFHDLARNVDLHETPLIACVSVADKPIAVVICLSGSTAVEFFMTTFDERYKAFSPGTMLTRWLIEWSLDRKLDFDFRIMMADYKKRWHAQVTTYHTYTIFMTAFGRIPLATEVKANLRRSVGAIRRALISITQLARIGRRQPHPIQ